MPEGLAGTLVGCAVEENALHERVAAFYEQVRPETPGVTEHDWVTAILQATSTTVPA